MYFNEQGLLIGTLKGFMGRPGAGRGFREVLVPRKIGLVIVVQSIGCTSDR